MQDPDTLALADLVRYEVDPDANYPKYFPGEVVLHFTDGRQVTHKEPINRGAPGRPIAHADIVSKFMDNAALAWPTTASTQLRDRVLSLSQHRARDLALDLSI